MIEATRRVIRFCLASFIWLHAVFFLNLPSAAISRLSGWLRLTGTETALFALLVAFSFVAGSGFWRGLGNLAYIYFFPFVLFFYFCIGLFRGLRACIRLTEQKPNLIVNADQDLATSIIVRGSDSESTPPLVFRKKLRAFILIVSRPVRRFAILWCLLLLITTHQWIIWAALIIVSLHLGRVVVSVIRFNFFPESWFTIFEKAIHANVDAWIAKLHRVTTESPANAELRGLLVSLQFWEKIVKFLQDEVLLSRWALLLGAVLFGSVYVYLSFVFSFVYYGVARCVAISSFSWLDFFVMALFMPFYVSALPHSAIIRLLAGLQCTLVLAIGIAGVLKYLRRQISSISTMATTIDVKLSEEPVKAKRYILEQKFLTRPEASGDPEHRTASA